MRIKIIAAAIAISVTNDAQESVMDYKIENYSLDADIAGIVKAGMEVGEQLAVAFDELNKRNCVGNSITDAVVEAVVKSSKSN